MKQRLASWLCLLAVAGTAGCSQGDHDFFPLGTRRSWEYSVQRVIKGEKHTQKILVAGLPPARLNGQIVYPRRRLDDSVELYRKSAQGIFRVTPDLRVEEELLPLPARVGAAWQNTTRVRFLQLTGAFSGAFNERAHTDMPIRYVIDSVNETVDVPAGRFQHCLKVTGKGSMLAGQTLEQFLDIHEIRVDETDWYAPGVGLVKLVRTESTSPANWSNRYLEQLDAQL